MKRIFCLILVCLLLGGCSRVEKCEKTLFAMDTVMELTIWGADAERAAGEIGQLLRTLEQQWTAPVQAEEDTLLARIQALQERTDGAFDPGLYALVDAWGFYDEQYRIPSQELIDSALADERLDLGGAVKGYAGQLAVQILDGMEIDRAILDLGGNIQTYGSKPGGEPWLIGIRDPDGAGELGIVSVYGAMSVVTSGDYQRYFEVDGQRYHHIFDPQTGWPADSGLQSVTVICSDGLTADVLSTALFVMGPKKGAAFWQNSGDFEAVFVLDSGEIWATQGARLSGCEFEVIRREK